MVPLPQAQHLVRTYCGKPSSRIPRYPKAQRLTAYDGRTCSNVTSSVTARLYANNLLLSKLKANANVEDARERYARALLAIAVFLEQMEPYGFPTSITDELADLALKFEALKRGIYVPILTPAVANRGDETRTWLARINVVRAIKVLCLSGHSRRTAAKWAVEKCPGLQCLITEKVSHRSDDEKHRSDDLVTVMINWCEYFDSRKIKNYVAKNVYIKLSDLSAWAPPNRDDDEREDEALRLLQKAISLI
jgi:hypothetical protein